MSRKLIPLFVIVPLVVVGWLANEAASPKGDKQNNPNPRGERGSATATATASRPGEASLDDHDVDLGGYLLTTPNSWSRMDTVTAVRRAEFLLPGDVALKSSELLSVFEKAAAMLTVLHHGPQVDEAAILRTLDRWKDRFLQGESARQEFKTSESQSEVAGLKLRTVVFEGKYMAPTYVSGEADPPQVDAMQVSYVLHTPRGIFFIRALGPQSTMAFWRDDLEDMIQKLLPVSGETK